MIVLSILLQFELIQSRNSTEFIIFYFGYDNDKEEEVIKIMNKNMLKYINFLKRNQYQIKKNFFLKFYLNFLM